MSHIDVPYHRIFSPEGIYIFVKTDSDSRKVTGINGTYKLFRNSDTGFWTWNGVQNTEFIMDTFTLVT